jgi:peptidoglycan/LPS O-acetylase OafA/YrhL
VDIFFVLSGFLITGILRRARSATRYYGPFWQRRARRIWPLGYAVLLAYFLTTCVLAPQFVSHSFWIVFLFLFQAMLRPVAEAGMPLWMAHYLGVAWSLSVEEWFYVVWAPVVRLFTHIRLVWVCAIVIVSDPVIRLMIHQPAFPEYFLLATRADALAWGALAALLLEQRDITEVVGRYSGAIVSSAIGAGTLGVLWTHNGDRDLIRTAVFGYSLIDAAAAAVLAGLVTSSGSSFWAARLCRWRALRHAGIVSYGMYLFHMPVFDITRFLLGSDSRATRLVAFTSTVALASLSWRYFEQPILDAHPRARTVAESSFTVIERT